MEVTYRPALLEDLAPAARLVTDAYNDLRSHHGLRPTISTRPPLFQRFCFTEKTDGFWIAEEDGTLVGFGFAWMRQIFWYLANLFVAPGVQGNGVGRGLMSRTLELAEQSGAARCRVLDFGSTSRSFCSQPCRLAIGPTTCQAIPALCDILFRF